MKETFTLNQAVSLQERAEILCDTLGIATGQNVQDACKNYFLAKDSQRYAACKAMVTEGFMTDEGNESFQATPKGISYVNVILNWPFAEQAAAKAERRAKKLKANQEAQQAIDDMLPSLLSKQVHRTAPWTTPTK